MRIQNSKEVLWLIQSFPGISEEGMLENLQFFIAAEKWLSPENNAGHYLREGGWWYFVNDHFFDADDYEWSFKW